MKDDLISQVRKQVMHEQQQRDGIPQVVVGAYLILYGLLLLAGTGIYLAVFVALIPLFIESLRKRITYPRIGYAKLIDKRTRRLAFQWLIVALMLAGILVYAVLTRVRISPVFWSQLHIWIMLFIAVVVLNIMAAKYLRNRNMLLIIYGVFVILSVAGILVFKLSKEAFYYAITGFGLINLVYGITTLVRFIRHYPVLKDEN